MAASYNNLPNKCLSNKNLRSLGDRKKLRDYLVETAQCDEEIRDFSNFAYNILST